MKIIEKDLLTVEKGILVQCCNARGKMGSGVALAIKNKYPIVYKAYLEFCKRYEYWPLDMLGQVVWVHVNDSLSIGNIIGQLDYGYDGKRYVDYCAVNLGLKGVSKFHYLSKLDVYLPYGMGAIRAGGDINLINRMIEYHIPNAILCKLS